MEEDEDDEIGYWDDREYVDDEYWDNAQLGALAIVSTTKRKRSQNVPESPNAKRRRVAAESVEKVKFVSLAKRLERFYELPPRIGSVKPFALLPDWRERFANSVEPTLKQTMPEAMKKAAEGLDEDTPPKKRHHDAFVEDEDVEAKEWMDEDDIEVDDQEEAEDMAAQLASLDPEMLKMVLKQRLGDMGLGDTNESDFMSAITKMLSKGQESDDATGDLASALLCRASEDKGSALAGWLGQQGVSLDAGKEDDDASSVATAELPAGSAKESTSRFQASPPDSAIELSKSSSENKQVAIHGSSPSASAKKRAVPDDSDDGVTSKRKKVTFEVPISAQTIQQALTDVSQEADKTNNSGFQVEKAATSAIDEETPKEQLKLPATIKTPISRDASSRYANRNAHKANGSASTSASEAKSYARPTAATSARQTRKRKAETEADDVENSTVVPKRPARKIAKSTSTRSNIEVAGQGTKSVKARK